MYYIYTYLNVSYLRKTLDGRRRGGWCRVLTVQCSYFDGPEKCTTFKAFPSEAFFGRG